jgi:hypothetical protein
VSVRVELPFCRASGHQRSVGLGDRSLQRGHQ